MRPLCETQRTEKTQEPCLSSSWTWRQFWPLLKQLAGTWAWNGVPGGLWKRAGCLYFTHCPRTHSRSVGWTALKGDALRLPPGIRVDEIGVRSSVGMLNGAQLFDEKQLLPLSGKDQGAIRTARRVMNILMLDCVRRSSMRESHTSVTKEVAGLAKYVHMKLEAGCSATGTGDLETWVAAYTRLSCEGSANIVVGHEQKHPVKPDTVVTHVLAVGDDYHRRRGVAHLDESPYQKAEAERLRRECKKGRPLRMVNLLEWGEYQAKR